MAEAAKASRWLPLESNPAVMNEFLNGMGLPHGASDYQFCDVFGLDPELLMMVPRPVAAVLLLFPCGEAHAAHRAQEKDEVTKGGQVVAEKLFYLKQYIGNACGTIGLMHAIGNNLDKIQLADGPLKTYLDKATALSPAEAGHLLEASDDISVAHEASAQEGQTEAPNLEDNVDLHFIAFVEKDGSLYEMDGRKEFPINHGATSAETLLEDSAAVVRKFMARDPAELRFNLVALAKQS